ncbi:Winged helix DNA-binding protein [Glarea lozoyensis ATCC 20868]|uniref:Vacuolar protein-sorting-associated protein 25 n=1 Tax=Glarea lozoyensis (strain ATCC 20868 / MF5171) TaxID=1116229 RepID=S3D5J2_GLAL2|nr:Winged helix DNA-binding protein [Glarea lozoyensis ATCC 20868]EPE32379.1 Winged helix DNA-binding protein [Glarea lozoyensis ATCC 20868]
MSTTQPFTFPKYYSYPPFFTRQPTLTSYHAQLQKWSSLILSYCRHHRLFKLSIIDALDSNLFNNKTLGRRLREVNVREVLEYMRKEGRVEWVGKGTEGNEVWVWWRNPEEWATAVYEWVDETAQKNTVLTLYELTESEATLSQGMIDRCGGVQIADWG